VRFVPTIATRDARIQYWKVGTGPAVILVQGAGVIGEGWRPQIDALRPHQTVIWIDNRGIGQSVKTTRDLSIESMAEDVLAVADAEAIRQFHLVGHSMGGLIAQQVALSQRDRTLSLAFLCTFLRGRQATMMSWRMLVLGMRSRIGTRRARRHAFVEMVMPADYLAATDRRAPCESLQGLFGRDLADQPPVILEQLRAMGRFDASSSLGCLSDVPTLVLSAEHDLIARPAFGRELAAAIPGATFVEIPAAGHAVTIQCPDRVNDCLLRHLYSATHAPLPSATG
jgi:pimeloyl-ACP methyl ester carboxylesterase